MIHLRIRKYAIFTFICALCLLNLVSLQFIGPQFLQITNDAVRVAASALIFLIYFARKRQRISSLVIIILIMDITLLISTVINQGNLLGCFGYVISVMDLVLLFEIMRGNETDLLYGFMCLGEIVCYANLATILLVPEGLYRSVSEAISWNTQLNWLLGQKNTFAPYLIVFCVTAFLYRQNGGSPFREWGIYIASFLSAFLAGSSASTFGFFLLPIGFLIIKHTNIKFNAFILFGAYVVLFFAIVIFRLQEIFAFIIEGILGKNLTFTGRVSIWDTVLQLIHKKPLLGYGVQQAGYLNSLIGISAGMHAHNMILQYLFEGGILYLGMYVIMLLLIFRRLHNEENNIESQCMIVAIFLFQTMALAEPYKHPYTFILYAYAYNIRHFIINDMKHEERTMNYG